MKKATFLILLVFVLVGCKPADFEEVSVMVPFGSTQFALLHVENNTEDYNVDVVKGPAPLVAAFGAQSHDVIVAPVNLGAKMFQSNQDYILLAVIGWGSFYLISNSDISSIEDLANKEVVLFGQNSTPDILLRHLIAEKNVLNVDLTYVDSVTTAVASFISNPDSIVMIAEPALSNLKNRGFDNMSIINLQEVYGSIHETDSFPSAGVFVKANLDSRLIAKIAQDIEDSIENVNHDPSAAATLAVNLEMGLPYEVILAGIPTSNLRYVSAQDSKADVIQFFEILMEKNSALIGGMLPEESFYYEG